MSQPTYGPKLLRRSRTDRYIGGVCGGLARYLNMDPTLVRVLTAVVTLFTGAPVILYLVALFFMPEEDVAPAVPPAGSDPVWGAGGPPWQAPENAPRDPAWSHEAPAPEPATGNPTAPHDSALGKDEGTV